MINKNAANKRINTAIKTVVPQPGNTLPASELSGRNKVPNGVTKPGSWKSEFTFDGLALEVPVDIID